MKDERSMECSGAVVGAALGGLAGFSFLPSGSPALGLFGAAA